MSKRRWQYRTEKAGLPPGTLMPSAKAAARPATFDVTSYSDADICHEAASSMSEALAHIKTGSVTWIDSEGAVLPSDLELIGRRFAVHPLVLEDILTTDQRPKVEDFGNYLYIVARMLSLQDDSGEVVSEQVSFILTDTVVISFQERHGGDAFDVIRERLFSGGGRIRKMGADYLVYALLDAIVDYYFLVLEKIGERLENLEESVLEDPQSDIIHDVHALKREMIGLRKSVWPLREVIGVFERSVSPLIQETTKLYTRDLYDHTIRVMDTVETFRDTLSGLLDVYLSMISYRMNQGMRVLTLIATLFMPLTLISGIYGMNFDHMPELRSPYGYPAVLAGMVIIAVVMVVFFKRKKWI